MGLYDRLPSGSTLTVVLLPVVVPVAYILYFKRSVSKQTSTQSGIRGHASASSVGATGVADPVSLPEHIKSNPAQWVVAYERVESRPIARASLAVDEPTEFVEVADQTQPSTLMRKSVAASHEAFSWTPQAIIIRSLIGDAHLKHTFDRDWIHNLAFKMGDIVNGVYRVSHVSGASSASERVELIIEVPPSYKGAGVQGIILATIEPFKRADGTESSDEVTFVNETWMWRRKDDKPTLLESGAGKWMHSMLAGWLILKSIAAVTGNRKTQ